MSFKKVDSQIKLPEVEEKILDFWTENKTFEKSLSIRQDAPIFSFYDGPPFATGSPHYGHLVASVMKDVVPRFFTMKGFRVDRVWGWDCHGLPIENIAEQELGIKQKKEIEEIGVGKFNDACRAKVLGYEDEWKKVIRRFGRWVDMENAYSTMDLDYMESVWWVFKQLYDKDLIYEGYRSMHICPRCETTLSQSEVAEGYKFVKDLSVVAEFKLIDELDTSFLAWTTTPWTLIANVALAVGGDIDYVKIEKKDEGTGKLVRFILAKDRLKEIFKEDEYSIIETVKGSQLVGKSYQPLFDHSAINEKIDNQDNGWKIITADFVTTSEGTGIVHIAPAFGEDDLNLVKKYHLPFIQHIGMDGIIKDGYGEFSGQHVKPIDDSQKTDIEIIKYLANKDLLFSKEKYEHSYPHCWRCDTPLLNYATSSWFVAVTKIKNQALELAQEINWSPRHIKEGRFGKWLEGARDWSISRQRYWASVIPIWRCSCGEIKVIGSIKELEDLSGQIITDLHKDKIDPITFSCEKCDKQMHRIPDVLDTWFDSGSMPYGQLHFPFENKEKFENTFPAQFIAEGQDQTRAWFYYLHLLSTAVQSKIAFKNAVVNGIVLAEDGKKMSKRLKNYPDPMEIINLYGADALRMYLLTSPVMQAENLNFNEKDLAEISRGFFRMLWNSYSFFTLYANIDNFKPQENPSKSENILDLWILSELNQLTKDVNMLMEKYELTKATRLFFPFVDNLSNWYIRRSRKRFQKAGDQIDKNNAYQTLYTVLVELSKLLAPFAPFIAEEIYQNLTGQESVHLVDFPKEDESSIDQEINQKMHETRMVIEQGLAKRSELGNKYKVRQPLAYLKYGKPFKKLNDKFEEIIKDEVNVKDIVFDLNSTDVLLDTEITTQLQNEGQKNDIMRAIQDLRKKSGYSPDDIAVLYYTGDFEIMEIIKNFASEIKSETKLSELHAEQGSVDQNIELVLNGKNLWLGVKK